MIVKLTINNNKEINTFGNKNEYSHVILNLLTNAINILVKRQVKTPEINVVISYEENKSIVTITDNAGGIRKLTLCFSTLYEKPIS